jgi:hypothetical protein
MKGNHYIITISALSIIAYSLLLQSAAYTLPPDRSYPHPDSINYDHRPLLNTIVDTVEWMGPHELMARKPLLQQQRIAETTKNYVTAWILFGLLIIGLLRYIFPMRFKEVFMAAWESRYFNQLEREGGLFTNWVSFFLYLNFLFSLSLLFYSTVSGSDNVNTILSGHPLLTLIYGLILASGFFFLKFVAMIFTGWIFKTKRPTESVIRIHLVIDQFTGIVILPVLVVNFYNPAYWILVTAWAIIILLNLYKLIRLSAIGLRMGGYSAYHLILYLCTIEIAPLLFIIKYSENFVSG